MQAANLLQEILDEIISELSKLKIAADIIKPLQQLKNDIQSENFSKSNINSDITSSNEAGLLMKNVLISNKAIPDTLSTNDPKESVIIPEDVKIKLSTFKKLWNLCDNNLDVQLEEKNFSNLFYPQQLNTAAPDAANKAPIFNLFQQRMDAFFSRNKQTLLNNWSYSPSVRCLQYRALPDSSLYDHYIKTTVLEQEVVLASGNPETIATFFAKLKKTITDTEENQDKHLLNYCELFSKKRKTKYKFGRRLFGLTESIKTPQFAFAVLNKQIMNTPTNQPLNADKRLQVFLNKASDHDKQQFIKMLCLTPTNNADTNSVLINYLEKNFNINYIKDALQDYAAPCLLQVITNHVVGETNRSKNLKDQAAPPRAGVITQASLSIRKSGDSYLDHVSKNQAKTDKKSSSTLNPVP